MEVDWQVLEVDEKGSWVEELNEKEEAERAGR